MIYYRNSQIAELYKVSIDTVANWIKAAKLGRIDLKLQYEKERYYIANLPLNHAILENLAINSKKFKNRRFLKEVFPKEEFYCLYNHDQIIDLISNIERYREIPQKFAYFGEGAVFWDKYAKRVVNKTFNSFNNTIQLLNLNSNYLYELIGKENKVNIVDIAVGNGITVKELLQSFISKDLLSKYFAFDYSTDMLKIAENNLRKWFDNLPYESIIGDMNYDRFQSVMFESLYSKYKLHTNRNILLLLGGTDVNQRIIDQPFRIINSSMGTEDILVYSIKLDSENSRRYFDFSSDDSKKLDIIEKERVVLEALGITSELYDVEKFYDESIKSRIIQIVLKSDIKINIKTDKFCKIVNLFSREKIVLWRAKHHTYADVMNLFAETGFEILHTSRSMDQEQLLVIAKVKKTVN